MDKQQATTLVKDTLETSFEKKLFIPFVSNLLKQYERAEFIRNGQYIPDIFKGHISSFERIGKYKDSEGKRIDILIVHLKKKDSLDRARSMQRNFVAGYLQGKFGSKTEKDAALVAFVAPDNEDWRFSLVKLEIKLNISDKGRISTKDDFTPARRWSFLVGKQEKSHTAQNRLVPILKEDEYLPTLKQFEEAFNIETVTKEFFEQYKKLFITLKEELDRLAQADKDINKDFESKHIDTAQFAKKLMGQIVFLYFLQKKGWLGVEQGQPWGNGPKNFLRELFNKKIVPYDNFHNDILEPLFYKALAVKNADDYFDPFQCKIPHLNGGLFEPLDGYDWEDTKIEINDSVFKDILDTFDLYNFTVREDEPLEKEVAVDPEMLGKVFENLLEVKDRKSKGAYYTPREIVHYMCQESLINYLFESCQPTCERFDVEFLIKSAELFQEQDWLAINKGKEDPSKYRDTVMPASIVDNAKLLDDALKTIRVCDPAIGSGAFPMGILTEIVKARNILSLFMSTSENRSIYQLKKDAIHHSIYGVDIDPSAVDISKLRLWLSLVVDEDDFDTINPLPNLDYKIMQGNSLIEEYEGIKLFDSKLLQKTASVVTDINELKQKLSALTKQAMVFYQENSAWVSNKKINRPVELFDIEKQIEGIKKQIEYSKGINKQKPIESTLFDLEEKSSIKIGEQLQSLISRYFDITDRAIKVQTKKEIELLELELIVETLKEKGKSGAIEKVKESFRSGIKPYFLWELNFSEVFQEKGGFDVVIGNPPYIDSESMVKTGLLEVREAIQRTYKMTKGNWDIYIAFFEQGFKILNGLGTLTYITPDKWISKPFGDELRKQKIDQIYSILKAGRKVFETAKVDSIITIFSNHATNHLNILSFNGMEIKYKRSIDKKSIHTPYALDHLFSDNLDLLCRIEECNNKISDIAICENACATSDAYKLQPLLENLMGDVFNPNIFLKIINTGTIGKFISKWGSRDMTYLKCKYSHPVVKRQAFFDNFRNSYSSKSVKPKIIIKGLNLLDACIDEDGIYIPGKTTLIIATKNIQNLKFILGIINSKLPLYYIKEKYPASSYNQGTTFTTDMLNNFPIPGIFNERLVELVDKVIALKKAEPNTKIDDLEGEIDELVYKLYDLTDEEIAIVKGRG